MSTIVKLEKHEIPGAMQLFKNVALGWDVMVEAAIDFGFFLADDRDKPNVALAFIGGCVVYGGDAGHPNARILVETMKVQPGILPHPPEWAALVEDVFSESLKYEQRYFLPFSSLDKAKLCTIDTGLKPGFELKKFDLGLAARLKDELGEEYHLHHYSSLEDFVERGCGFCICRGNEICASAIAGLRGKNAIQIQINTKEQYRRQGFATKVGTALLKYCFETGIRADWDAGNTQSRDLALKLGFSQCIPYRILSAFPD